MSDVTRIVIVWIASSFGLLAVGLYLIYKSRV